MRNKIYATVIIVITFSNRAGAQFDASNYCYTQSDVRKVIAILKEPVHDFSSLGGIPCNANTFYSLTAGGTIEELEINGNTISSNGAIANANGFYSLAYCNNINGGGFSPTFYSHKGSTFPLAYY